MRATIVSLVILSILLVPVGRPVDVLAECDMEAYLQQRQQMVAGQIQARGVRAVEVIRAMEQVPRHCFVPRRWQSQAYRDGPLPIGHGQTISQPYIVALMSELLALQPGQRVLEIGTGSGYQAAVLAQMGIDVYTIEIIEPLARQARKALLETGYAHIHTKIGDGYQGWPDQAPFDGIIVTCAPTHIPSALKDQLAEGGRMVIPVGETYGNQRLILLRKIKGRISEERDIAVRFVPMIDKDGKPY